MDSVYGDQGALPSPSLPLKSPLGHVKAFLPNNQHTSVRFVVVHRDSIFAPLGTVLLKHLHQM